MFSFLNCLLTFFCCFCQVLKSNANVTVAMDGTGDYKTVMEAIIAAPVNSKLRYIIYVKKGIYNEIVKIEDTKTNLIIIGDGRDDTILSGNLNANDGIKTYDSATLGTVFFFPKILLFSFIYFSFLYFL